MKSKFETTLKQIINERDEDSMYDEIMQLKEELSDLRDENESCRFSLSRIAKAVALLATPPELKSLESKIAEDLYDSPKLLANFIEKKISWHKDGIDKATKMSKKTSGKLKL